MAFQFAWYERSQYGFHAVPRWDREGAILGELIMTDDLRFQYADAVYEFVYSISAIGLDNRAEIYSNAVDLGVFMAIDEEEEIKKIAIKYSGSSTVDHAFEIAKQRIAPLPRRIREIALSYVVEIVPSGEDEEEDIGFRLANNMSILLDIEPELLDCLLASSRIRKRMLV